MHSSPVRQVSLRNAENHLWFVIAAFHNNDALSAAQPQLKMVHKDDSGYIPQLKQQT